jgi:hypothetical protein
VDSVEDIDARLDVLTSAIHETMSASAPKSQTAKQPNISILPMILVNIQVENRLRRQWQIDREPHQQESNQSSAINWYQA